MYVYMCIHFSANLDIYIFIFIFIYAYMCVCDVCVCVQYVCVCSICVCACSEKRYMIYIYIYVYYIYTWYLQMYVHIFISNQPCGHEGLCANMAIRCNYASRIKSYINSMSWCQHVSVDHGWSWCSCAFNTHTLW